MTWEVLLMEAMQKNFVKRAIVEIQQGKPRDPQAISEAVSLVRCMGERMHPSCYNTIFAVAVFFPEAMDLELCAWRMVANGLGGFWQFESHNGGVFSVTAALLHLEIITEEEAENIQQFVEHETHSGYHYCVLKPELLARLVLKFNLPTTNKALLRERKLSTEELRTRKRLESNCSAGMVAQEGAALYEAALAKM